VPAAQVQHVCLLGVRVPTVRIGEPHTQLVAADQVVVGVGHDHERHPIEDPLERVERAIAGGREVDEVALDERARDAGELAVDDLLGAVGGPGVEHEPAVDVGPQRPQRVSDPVGLVLDVTRPSSAESVDLVEDVVESSKSDTSQQSMWGLSDRNVSAIP
jgi:hypothetical protein